MCYYNGQKVTRDEYIRLKQLEKLVAKYDFLDKKILIGFDFGKTAVLKPIPEKEDFELVQMEWGFLPDPLTWPFIETREQADKVRHGYKDATGRVFPPLNFLNAVSEELLFKNKVYRDAALHRRCLILSTGFYEWRHITSINKRTGQPLKTPVKYPYRITMDDRDYFFLAGIWQPWEDAETGEYVETCAIITTQANIVMEQIHNSKKRMPTILTDDLAYEWIFGRLSEERISQIAQWQVPWDELSYYPLAKDFLSSIEPTKPVLYPEVPTITTPGNDTSLQSQLSIFN